MGELQTLAIGAPPLRLHAWKLKFIHPGSGETLRLSAHLPTWASDLKADQAAMDLAGEDS
jgi:hypothetical protein